MHSLVELRVDERYASLLFNKDEGQRLGDSVRKIVLRTDDSRFDKVGALQAKLRRDVGEPFFYGWKLYQRYAASELASARLFHVEARKHFEPSGEECGTRYDETVACARCGAGAVQVGPLILPDRRIPRGVDFASTIAGEEIVSRRTTVLFREHAVKGVSFEPVRTPSPRGIDLSEWSQLRVLRSGAEIVPPTRVGDNPFDADESDENRCDIDDHLLGLNLLSEVYVDAGPMHGSDVFYSRQYIGVRRGLLRPQRVLLVTPRVRQLILDAGLRGFSFTVARQVNGNE